METKTLAKAKGLRLREKVAERLRIRTAREEKPRRSPKPKGFGYDKK